MSHLIEVYTNCYGEYGLRAMFEHLPLPQCHAVEFALKPHLVKEAMVTEKDTLTETASDEDAFAMRSRLDEAGVLATSANGGDTLSDPEGVRRVRRRVEMAQVLGVRTFVASCGWRNESLEGIYPVVRELGEHARERGMVLALETHSPLVTNSDVALGTLDAVGCDNVLINWDTANIYYMNDGIDGVAELRRVADRVGHVHLKDSRKKPGEWFFPALGEGTIDFAEVFGILDEAGFTGTMSLEIEGIAGEVPALEVRRKRIEDSLAHLARLGLI